MISTQWPASKERFYRNPTWPPKRFYGTSVTFRIEPPLLGYPFKTFPEGLDIFETPLTESSQNKIPETKQSAQNLQKPSKVYF